VFYRVGNHADAEDLVARVFYRALGNIARYKQRGAPFTAWLYRIAHNLVANWHRDQVRRRTLRLDDVATLVERRAGPEGVAEQNEARRVVLDALHTLSAERQELVILKFSEGLSNAAIGQIMGRSESAIKSLYHRTLIELRAELSRRGETREVGER
jgi:RNA polymerase sigma-70 factor (ECF subfamily)